LPRDIRDVIVRHLRDLYSLYGVFLGVRIARKHVGWYMRSLPGAEGLRTRFNGLETCDAQLAVIDHFFTGLADRSSTDGCAGSLAA
jgi:tRNA-dihydrouridine synthase B